MEGENTHVQEREAMHGLWPAIRDSTKSCSTILFTARLPASQKKSMAIKSIEPG
jgi:hypothetical protein